MNHRLLPHLALSVVAVIYGMNFVIAKNVMAGGYLTPFQFILLRVCISSVMFWIFLVLFVRQRISYSDLPYLILCAFLGTAVNQLSFFAGLNLTSPIHASLLMTLVPIVVLTVSAVMLKEAVTPVKVLGVILGISGALYLILAGKTIGLSENMVKGDLMVLINVLSYSMYLVLVKRLMDKYHPVTVVTWLFTFGMIMVVPFGLPGIAKVPWSEFSLDIWLGVFYVVVCTTFIAYLFNAYAISKVNPSTVSIYIYLQPLVASIAAILINEEPLGWEKIVSGIMIFTGVYFVSFSSRPGPE